ncbi:MAG: enoyl-CoA hydratase [Reyranella sp.]|jgi:enoyl-CoA hydratase/carnithine racemase|uniref:enoyl-CoA hydratase n=1 Tax=Reyranella sp. TaxID=1929291 RepID=UPI00095F7F37|nr:enoyl-CoA hydratase [Reyranella sp.]MBR2817567.1 enoyl-CoA hydratase [Reyranella sp.]OJU31055.1 MAG: enoyl-CoA hydratase [Alphaproteobacteria bacterium 65-37]
MTTNHVLVSRDGAVLTIIMNRPDKKNALTGAMYGAMADALASAASDTSVRVVLITGTGDAFTAGNDLGDFVDAPPTGGDSPVIRFLVALSSASKPVVAAVNGLAVGVGTTMLLHCDLVYAGHSATFSVPFVNLALVPEAASSLLLPRRIGHARAAELFLLGGRLDARQAEAMGLVAAVFDDDRLVDEALRRARALATKAPTAVRATKALMKRGDESVADRMQAESELFRLQLKSSELKEAIQAFREKRAPNFDKAT